MADYSELIKMGKNTSLMSNLFVGQSLPSLRIMFCARATPTKCLWQKFSWISGKRDFTDGNNIRI